MPPLKTRVRQQREKGVETAARLLLESGQESAKPQRLAKEILCNKDWIVKTWVPWNRETVRLTEKLAGKDEQKYEEIPANTPRLDQSEGKLNVQDTKATKILPPCRQ